MLTGQPEADRSELLLVGHSETVTGVAGPGLRVPPGVDHRLQPARTPVNDSVLALSAVAALQSFAQRWAIH